MTTENSRSAAHRRSASGAGRTLAFAAGAAGAIIAGAAVGAGLSVLLARAAVMPAREPDERVRVDALRRVDGRLMVRLVGPDAALPGIYSLLFDRGAGHARLGPAISAPGTAVAVREVLGVDRGELRAGAIGRVTGWWFTEPEELGLRTERIRFETELGEAEAWLIRPRRARKRRWAVHVHGRGALPEETLRGVQPLARAGITSLVISYRNDPEAPSGVAGRYGLGVAESRDVDAAIAEALRRGAERVTLCGWSMGGTASLIAATAGAHRSRIDGLILDSPAVDWLPLLRYHASLKGMPRLLADAGVRLLGAGTVRGGEPGGLDIRALSPHVFAGRLDVPVLIHAGRRDTFVPPTGAERLAQLRPDLVQLRLQDEGEHVKLWNVDPAAWETVTERFARALPRPAYRGE